MRVTSRFRRVGPRGERGVTMILVALAMVAIIAMAAMSIDLVTLYLAREEAQRMADASALAAARLISVSGMTASGSGFWSSMCGGLTGWATQAALAVSFQNTVGGHQTNVDVKYSDGTSTNADCQTLGPAFAVNPMVTVVVTPVSIPSFFSRIWGSTSNSVSATATAEVFNPSGSANTGVSPNGLVTPVQPKCVKPWIVPNLDPGNAGFTLVTTATGQIRRPGVSTDLTGSAGIVGEQLYLVADCNPINTTKCLLTPPADNPPKAGPSVALGPPLAPRKLEYLPGAVTGPIAAVPSCASAGTIYEKAVAGCDQTTVYQCGQSVAVNTVDLNEYPGGVAGDTATGLACSLTNTSTVPLDGQDTLISTGYPFVAIAGDRNPLNISGSPVVNSNSIMTLPIYDQTANGNTISTTNNPVTIIGFLQVFVNDVAPDGSVLVTVLNVAACGSNATTNTALTTNSPVPVRLITPH
jgi:Flp pilus assembly protein TadG